MTRKVKEKDNNEGMRSTYLTILLKRLKPSGVIITETNVPEKENISYLKDSDEANLVFRSSFTVCSFTQDKSIATTI